MEITFEYDYSSQINEFQIVWTSQLSFVEAEMARILLSTLLNQPLVHNRISAIPASTKDIWLLQAIWNSFISWLISYYNTIHVKYMSYNT
jgi:hypothetical protein